MHIGFLGLGNMGGPMARNLLKAGHSLTVFDPFPQAVATLVEAGACLLYTSPSPRDRQKSRMPSSA